MKQKMHRLETLYVRMLTHCARGENVTPDFIKTRFKVTALGANCLFLMLLRGEYLPDLESLYESPDVSDVLRVPDADDACFIRFVEDVPPFLLGGFYCTELSDHDKHYYIMMGLAVPMCANEVRQWYAHRYVLKRQALREWQANAREAIAHHDASSLRHLLATNSKARIFWSLKMHELDEKEITAARHLLKI